MACAETTDSNLITADQRFADKAVDKLPGAPVRYIGAPGVTDWLESGANALVIEREKVEALIVAYDVFAKTEQFVVDSLSMGTEEPSYLKLTDLGPAHESPSHRHLINSVIELNNEERIDLLALGWFGAGLFPNWRHGVEHHEKMVAGFDPHYAAGYGPHWRAGYKRVTGG